MSRRPVGSLRSGFTLVEVLIVVLIMGVLLSVAMPQFIRARENSSTTGCQFTLRELQGAKERWAMDNNRPADATPVMSDLVVPGVYLKSTPQCPAGGTYHIGRLNEPPQCSLGGEHVHP